MAPPSSVPANAAAVAGRGGSECRICPNPRLTAAAGVRPTPSFYPFILYPYRMLTCLTPLTTTPTSPNSKQQSWREWVRA